VRYITLEEHYSSPRLKEPIVPGITKDALKEFERKLADFGEERLAEMDANGIEVQVISLTTPGLQATGRAPAEAVEAARAENDALGEAIAQHPDRYRGFAALPLQDPSAAVEELRRAVETLGFRGALVNDHTDGHYLDEPQYDDLWAALEALNVPLYLHPGAPPTEKWRLLDGYPELVGAMWSWGAQTAGHAMRVLCGGVFDRHPQATLILGHMGEFLPFQRWRLDSRYAVFNQTVALQRRPSEYVGTNIVATISGVFSSAVIEGAVRVMGADALMFSVDYPYEHTEAAVQSMEGAELSDDDREKIAHGNARRILGL